MATREEIKDTVIANITKACPQMANRDIVELADTILQDEDSQGVVIKVERELPKRTWYKDWGGESGKAGYELCQEDMAGYAPVESLIEKSGS